MTERLYYKNSFQFDFLASVEALRELSDGRRALVLDRSAFYPTGGGQPFDTGWIEFVAAEGGSPASLPIPKVRVSEVIEDESDGTILHVVEPLGGTLDAAATRARLHRRGSPPGPHAAALGTARAFGGVAEII